MCQVKKYSSKLASELVAKTKSDLIVVGRNFGRGGILVYGIVYDHRGECMPCRFTVAMHIGEVGIESAEAIAQTSSHVLCGLVEGVARNGSSGPYHNAVIGGFCLDG